VCVRVCACVCVCVCVCVYVCVCMHTCERLSVHDLFCHEQESSTQRLQVQSHFFYFFSLVMFDVSYFFQTRIL